MFFVHVLTNIRKVRWHQWQYNNNTIENVHEKCILSNQVSNYML